MTKPFRAAGCTPPLGDGLGGSLAQTERVDAEEGCPENFPALLSEEELAGAEIRSERHERI